MPPDFQSATIDRRAFSAVSSGETVQQSFVCQGRINNDVLSVLLIFWVVADWIWKLTFNFLLFWHVHIVVCQFLNGNTEDFTELLHRLKGGMVYSAHPAADGVRV